MPALLQGRDPTVETSPAQDRIDSIDKGPHPADAQDAVMERGEPAKIVEVMLVTGHDVVDVVVRRDRGRLKAARHIDDTAQLAGCLLAEVRQAAPITPPR